MVNRACLALMAFCLLPQLSLAQLDRFAQVRSQHPDFGATNGSWGHIQYYRPYGLKGIIFNDIRDLTAISPLTGEPFNTSRQGWLPLIDQHSLWGQLHPELTAPADTLAPSTLVNYRQGDGSFKDFTLWYHNSLDQATRYGWTSKLRSHPRVLDATIYTEQRHRFQLSTQVGNQNIQIEAGYSREVNPLYMLAQDSLLVTRYDDIPQIHSTRWDGSMAWDNLGISELGTEVFALTQGGLWDWRTDQARSRSVLAYVKHHFKLFGWGISNVQAGYLSGSFGNNHRDRPFFGLSLPSWQNKWFQIDAGLFGYGTSEILPKLKIHFNTGPLSAGAQTHQLIQDQLRNQSISIATLQEVYSELKWRNMNFSIRSWAGGKVGYQTAGVAADGTLLLPWNMSVMLGGASLDKTNDWVFSEQYVHWQVKQGLALFQEVLHTELKVWGSHHYDTQLGVLDPDVFQISPSSVPGVDILHLLNYTISGQVSTMNVSYTDQSILQDALWAQYASIPWDAAYSIMVNQIPNTRFRYLTIIWTFDN